jgi:ABC-type sugar transport system, ATPase component
MAEIVLSAKNITKEYPGTRALDDVSFAIEKGKVNVLIGENGAGKSTLMKIVAGIEQPTSGTLVMDGEEFVMGGTNEARRHGIAIIHQELSLFPNLNVYQNLFMNNERTRFGIALDNKKHRREAEKVLDRLNYPIPVDTLVKDLRVGQQQMVEVARNLIQDNLRILIMDEPTSSLSAQEVEALFGIMRELLARGISIVYISHRLEEIMRIGDNVTILRNGRKVAHEQIQDIDVPRIVRYMTGKEKDYTRHSCKVDYQTPDILTVKGLSLPKSGGGYLLNDVSFGLKKGEILGVYGLLGSGRTEIFECLMGIRPEHTGEVLLEGDPIAVKNVAGQIRRGLALVPEDRQREGLVRTLDIRRNLSLSVLTRLRKGPFLDFVRENRAVDEQIDAIQIKVADKALPILSLSGGNQQKVVIGKGLLTEPRIFLLDEPSRGIDIGAKTEVFEIIRRYAENGLSSIVISSELNEIIAIADRILVLSNGKLTGEFSGADITEENLVLASYKGHHSAGYGNAASPVAFSGTTEPGQKRATGKPTISGNAIA